MNEWYKYFYLGLKLKLMDKFKYNRINLLNIYENNGTYLFSNLWIDFIQIIIKVNGN